MVRLLCVFETLFICQNRPSFDCLWHFSQLSLHFTQPSVLLTMCHAARRVRVRVCMRACVSHIVPHTHTCTHAHALPAPWHFSSIASSLSSARQHTCCAECLQNRTGSPCQKPLSPPLCRATHGCSSHELENFVRTENCHISMSVHHSQPLLKRPQKSEQPLPQNKHYHNPPLNRPLAHHPLNRLLAHHQRTPIHY